MNDALYNLPKAIAKNQNLSLPAIEKLEDSYEDVSDNLEAHGMKIIIPSNILDIYTRLEVFLGLKLSGPKDTLTEANNLIDEF